MVLSNINLTKQIKKISFSKNVQSVKKKKKKKKKCINFKIRPKSDRDSKKLALQKKKTQSIRESNFIFFTNKHLCIQRTTSPSATQIKKFGRNESSMSSANIIFHHYWKWTKVLTKIILLGLTVSGIFQFQHRFYFQDKLILQTTSKLVSTTNTFSQIQTSYLGICAR